MKKLFSGWIKPYLEFSKKDRDGIIVLTVLILLAFLANIIIGHLPQKNKSDYTGFERALTEWEKKAGGDCRATQLLFAFNPNTIPEDSLASLLLPEYVKSNLLKYREAGGKIKAATDFRKIYGVNDSIFSVIKDYIAIPEVKQPLVKQTVTGTGKKNMDKLHAGGGTQGSHAPRPPELFVELNRADSSTLVQLRGIGPVFASRILKYRGLLGGFYSKGQLLEVYNFPEETYKSIEGKITVDPSMIQKIRLNFASYPDLLRHPYLDKKQVRGIIGHREKNGAFDAVEDLLRLNLVDSATYSKVKPYISSR